MTPEERIALDALEQVGVTRVSMWDLRCLDAYRASCHVHGYPKVTEYNTPAAHAEQRYKHDLMALGLDGVHGLAQWDDAEWTARRHGETHRPTRPEPEMFQESLT